MAFTSAITVNKSMGSTAGWRTHLEGTWTATAVSKGKVALAAYITRIERGGVNCLTGTGVTKWGLNVDADGSAEAASIGVLACTAADTGQWWAEGPHV